ncbi:hypothetical protein GN956_G18498 [Arapaima gigas]
MFTSVLGDVLKIWDSESSQSIFELTDFRKRIFSQTCGPVQVGDSLLCCKTSSDQKKLPTSRNCIDFGIV